MGCKVPLYDKSRLAFISYEGIPAPESDSGDSEYSDLSDNSLIGDEEWEGALELSPQSSNALFVTSAQALGTQFLSVFPQIHLLKKRGFHSIDHQESSAWLSPAG
jgi:hypothetical protein